MHLQRIQVPDFRVLKDVDITFEKEFFPSIFPVGSLNGGGKSTLLQLIFVLLHCSIDSEKKVFLKNILNDFKIYENAKKRVMAIVEIWDGDKSVRLEFFSYKNYHIRDLLDQDKTRDIDDTSNEPADYRDINFSILEDIRKMRFEIFRKRTAISEIKKNVNRLQQAQIEQELKIAETELEELHKKREQMDSHLEKVLQYFQDNKLIYICNYSVNGDEDEDEVLMCQIDNVDIDKAEYFLKKLSQKVFLAAPATQVFIFLSKESRKLLFRSPINDNDNDEDESNENNNYYSELQKAKSKLSGFFAYDFLAVDLLIESFKAARDRDFIKAIETGEYGNNYKELISDLSAILINKKVNINIDLSGVNFYLDRDEKSIELNPEDLSHGELKRLGIYMWIKSHNIENAIVLMDEIEIAFHPDWQYQIISDLQQWAPNNQYILATHSYELCQALTPSHVKELEPKLLKQEA